MPPKKDYAARVNDRAMVEDARLARLLWIQLKSCLLSENTSEYFNNDNEEELPNEEREQRENFQDCIGLNDNLRIYRYIPGHYFGQHYDESVKASVLPLDGTQVRKSGETHWTLLIYLTGETEGEVSGGGTIFYPNEHEAATYGKTNRTSQSSGKSSVVHVKTQKGMLLLHKHGDDCFLHEGEKVTGGVKWIFRSDLVYPLT